MLKADVANKVASERTRPREGNLSANCLEAGAGVVAALRHRLESAGLPEHYQLRKQLAKAAEREGPLGDAFEQLAGPERVRIRAALPRREDSAG